MVNGALFMTKMESVVTESPATSRSTTWLISKLSIAISPYYEVPLPLTPTEAVILKTIVSKKPSKQTVS